MNNINLYEALNISHIRMHRFKEGGTDYVDGNGTHICCIKC